jgi:hypothetical protein
MANMFARTRHHVTLYVHYLSRYSYTILCRTCTLIIRKTEVFSCFFLSCKANARVKLAKTGHGPQSSALVCICVVRLLFLLFCVLFVCKCALPPGDNPTAVNKYNNNNNNYYYYYCTGAIFYTFLRRLVPASYAT